MKEKLKLMYSFNKPLIILAFEIAEFPAYSHL